MPMHKELHPRDDVDRLYVSSKEGEKGLTSVMANENKKIPGWATI